MGPHQHAVKDMETLLVSAKVGDRSHLGVLLNLYRGYLLTIANRSLESAVSVKIAPSDLVQETLLKASAEFSKFDGSTEADLRGWLATILRRKAVDAHRHYRRVGQRDISREMAMNGHLAELVATVESPSAAIRAAERQQVLRLVLKQLGEESRLAIQLRSIEQVEFAEIGRRMGKSAEAARKLWARAIQELAIKMKAYESNSTRPL